MKKKARPLLIIGAVLIVLNCISLISDPTVIPDVLAYGGQVYGNIFGSILGLVGAFSILLLGLILIGIYLMLNRRGKNKV